MRKLVVDRNLDSRIEIDSAGTIGYHAGSPSDPRMRAAGTRRGYRFDHLARQVRREDFQRFDYILAMDQDNLESLERIWPSGPHRAELSLFLSHCPDLGVSEVPDPYYGGAEGFERVMDLVETGCRALLDRIIERHGLQ